MTAPQFRNDTERKAFESGMAEARRKGWKPPVTIQELEARTMREGLEIVRKRLEAARRSKSLAAPAAATTATSRPFQFCAGDLAKFKAAVKQAVLPVLLAAVPKAPARPAPPPPGRARFEYSTPSRGRVKYLCCGPIF